jgi:hypothetical protein
MVTIYGGGGYSTSGTPILDDSGTFLPLSTVMNATTPPITVPDGKVFGGWIIANVSSGFDYTALQVVQPGEMFGTTDYMQVGPYWVSSNVPCFAADSEILCYSPITNEETYVPIQSLRKGDLVKTCFDGYKKVDMIGTSKMYNPGNSQRSKNRLYRLTPSNYPELTNDLFLTGCHSILVKNISDEERAQTVELLNRIFVTDKHYRLMACVDRRAEPYTEEGLFDIYHLALENKDYYMNYGIYANGGLLVETTCQRMLKELSGMELIE